VNLCPTKTETHSSWWYGESVTTKNHCFDAIALFISEFHRNDRWNLVLNGFTAENITSALTIIGPIVAGISSGGGSFIAAAGAAVANQVLKK